MKKILKGMGFALGMLSCINFAQPILGAQKSYYSNDKGMSLTYKQYEYITRYIKEEHLSFYYQEEIDYLIKNVDNDGVETETKYVKTTINTATNECIAEEYLTEDEMVDEYNCQNMDLNTMTYSSRSSSAYSLDGRTDKVETNMKSIEMVMSNVGASTRKVTLTCTWLSLPKTRSFDVIAFRVPKKTITVDSTSVGNIKGYQYYDDKVVEYTHTTKNLKICDYGLGMSMNIADNVSKSLKMTLSVNFGGGVAVEDSCTIYGTYQHATKDVTLAKSQKYSIKSSGMGKVLDFSWTVESKYDNTPGLVVTGSIMDGLEGLY